MIKFPIQFIKSKYLRYGNKPFIASGIGGFVIMGVFTGLSLIQQKRGERDAEEIESSADLSLVELDQKALYNEQETKKIVEHIIDNLNPISTKKKDLSAIKVHALKKKIEDVSTQLNKPNSTIQSTYTEVEELKNNLEETYRRGYQEEYLTCIHRNLFQEFYNYVNEDRKSDSLLLDSDSYKVVATKSRGDNSFFDNINYRCLNANNIFTFYLTTVQLASATSDPIEIKKIQNKVKFFQNNISQIEKIQSTIRDVPNFSQSLDNMLESPFKGDIIPAFIKHSSIEEMLKKYSLPKKIILIGGKIDEYPLISHLVCHLLYIGGLATWYVIFNTWKIVTTVLYALIPNFCVAVFHILTLQFHAIPNDLRRGIALSDVTASQGNFIIKGVHSLLVFLASIFSIWDIFLSPTAYIRNIGNAFLRFVKNQQQPEDSSGYYKPIVTCLLLIIEFFLIFKGCKELWEAVSKSWGFVKSEHKTNLILLNECKKQLIDWDDFLLTCFRIITLFEEDEQFQLLYSKEIKAIKAFLHSKMQDGKNAAYIGRKLSRKRISTSSLIFNMGDCSRVIEGARLLQKNRNEYRKELIHCYAAISTILQNAKIGKQMYLSQNLQKGHICFPKISTKETKLIRARKAYSIGNMHDKELVVQNLHIAIEKKNKKDPSVILIHGLKNAGKTSYVQSITQTILSTATLGIGSAQSISTLYIPKKIYGLDGENNNQTGQESLKKIKNLLFKIKKEGKKSILVHLDNPFSANCFSEEVRAELLAVLIEEIKKNNEQAIIIVTSTTNFYKYPTFEKYTIRQMGYDVKRKNGHTYKAGVNKKGSKNMPVDWILLEKNLPHQFIQKIKSRRKKK